MIWSLRSWRSLQSYFCGRHRHLLQGSWITCCAPLCWWHLCLACKGSLSSWFTYRCLCYTPKLGVLTHELNSLLVELFGYFSDGTFAEQKGAETTRQDQQRWQGMSWRPAPVWDGSWRPAGQCKSVSSDTNANVLAVEWSARCLLSVGKINL